MSGLSKKIFWRIILLVTCMYSHLDAAPSKTPKLRFSSKTVALSGAGLQLKLLDNSREVPTSSPTAYLYTITSGSKETKLEMYSPVDLWKISQTQGKWIDPYNNSMTLATMTLPLPSGFPREHVPLPLYETAIKKSGGKRNDWTQAQMRAWVADFLGVEKVTSNAINPPSFKILDMMEFQVPDSGTTLSYALRLNPKAASVHKADKTWFFITVNINPQIRTLSARQTISASLFPSISVAKKSTKSTKSASSDFQSSTVEKGDGKSAEYKASKKRVAASISNMSDWWYAETKNYIFLSNLGISHKVFIKDMQEDLENLRSAYAKLLPPQTPITAVSVVRVFANDQEYIEYVGPDYQWSSGLWMSSKKEMIIRSANGPGNKRNRDVVRRIMYHEGFHQYLHYSMDQLHASVWFNEGHAVFFENGTIKSRYFYAEEDNKYITSVTRMIKTGALNLSELIAMDYKTFYSSNAEKRSDNYALAWALVYYLRKYAPLEKPANYTQILDTYIASLAATKNPDKATKEAFKDINMYNLENNFKAFWNSKNKRGYAKRNLLFK